MLPSRAADLLAKRYIDLLAKDNGDSEMLRTIRSLSGACRMMTIAAIMVLVGCGSSAGPPVGFVNQTQHSNADLWAIWKTAQDKIAQRVDLNPVQRFLNQAPADIRAGDSRALSVVPRQVQVASEPDVLSTALFAATGNYRADPTGLIVCPAPCTLRYAAAYSLPRVTKYAASWELQGDDFSIVLEYEFENQIMTELGYDMQWR